MSVFITGYIGIFKKETGDMKDSFRLLPAGISLFAGLVVSIVMLVTKTNSLRALILVFAFLLGFYIIGLIFRAVLIKFETKPEEPEEKEEQTEDISTENEEK